MAIASAILSQMSPFEQQNSKQCVIIYQTKDNDQIMLPELGDRYALEAYFRFHGVKFQLDQRTNAEDMSPDGVLPFIRHGNINVSGYSKIIEFVNQNYGIQDDNNSRFDPVSLTTLFADVVPKCELYYTWLHKEIYDQYTSSYYSHGKPWPLGNILCSLKKWDIYSKLGDSNRMVEMDNLCSKIQEKLDTGSPFIYGDKPTELDTLIYGHVKAIDQCRSIYKDLYCKLEEYHQLVNFMKRVEVQLPKE